MSTTPGTDPEIEETVDKTLEDTFPASDPPAWTLGRESPASKETSQPAPRQRAQPEVTTSEDTPQPLTVVGIVGSLRRHSYNRAVLRAAQHLLPPHVTFDIVDLAAIPPFNQDDEQTPPPAVVELKRRVRAADAVVFATPEYNYSIPGVLKNAIDWGSRPPGDNVWDGKPAAIVGASVGKLGTARAQYHLRQVLVTLNMFPLNRPEVMIGNASERFDPQGNLTDKETLNFLQKLLDQLVQWTRRLQRSRS